MLANNEESNFTVEPICSTAMMTQQAKGRYHVGIFSFLAVLIPVLAAIMDIVHKVRDNPMWTAWLNRSRTAWLKRSATTVATPPAQPEKPGKPKRLPWLDQTIAQVLSLVGVFLLILKAYFMSSSPATTQDAALVGLLAVTIIQASSMAARPISALQVEYKFQELVVDQLHRHTLLLIALAENKVAADKQDGKFNRPKTEENRSGSPVLK